MQFKKYLFTLIFISCSIFSYAQQDTTLSLQQCLDIAIKNNLNVKQSGLIMMQDNIYLKQARENLFPSISGSASRELSQGRGLSPVTNTYVNQSLTSDNYGLSGNMVIFNGLSLQNAIKQASLQYQAGKMDFQAAKDLVTVTIITNYLSILDAEEVLGQSKSQLAVAKENLDHSQVLENNGANKVASDFTDFKGAYAQSQVNLVQAQNSLDAAKLSLFQLMNIPYDRAAKYQSLNVQELGGQYGADADQIYSTALQQLAMVKAATLRRESAEKGVKVAKGQLFPTLSVSGGISTNYSSAGTKSVFIDSVSSAVPGLFINTPSGKQAVYSTSANNATQNISYGDQFKNNYGTYAILSLNIPIFTNHVKKNNVALAKINLLNEQYVEDNIKIQLRQNVEQAYYNMMAAYNRYQSIKAQVDAYGESYRIAKIRLDAGVLTSIDFIIAKNNLDGANLNLISARYDYFIYSKVLDYYQGKLSF